MSTAENLDEYTLDNYVENMAAHEHPELGRILTSERRARQFSQERYQNGMDEFGVYLKQGGKLFIHVPSFRRWFASHR
jgi:hypothetical protein